MKAFNFLVITLLFCLKDTAADKPTNKCLKDNEEYVTCGTACPLTCDNYLKPPTFCTKQCVIGCACRAGYVRNSAGHCVLPCDCMPEVPQCTGKFEKYNACGTACPLTCDNYKSPPGCTKQCVPGCYCKEGYVRNRSGKCVQPCDCPQVPTCPAHEVYNKCGTACPLTCKNRSNPPKFCTMQCVEGCECTDGYIRDEISGKCVKPCDCPANHPPKCRLPHEEYNKCGSACPDTCENYKKSRQCTLQCVEGCFCKPGFVRNKDKRCVLPCDC